MALGLGWGAGVAASLLGFTASVAFDAPTGAAMVSPRRRFCSLPWPCGPSSSAHPRRGVRTNAAAAFVGAATAVVAVFAQGVWLVVQPTGDQPLLAAVEGRLGIGPERFLTETERRVFHEAAETERRHRAEVERLSGLERDARWRGQALREDELRRLASFQQTFNEMGRGERFVQDHLRAVARARERWVIGVPMIVVSSLLLAWCGIWGAAALTPTRPRLSSADVVRASQVQHAVEHVGADVDLGGAAPVGARVQPILLRGHRRLHVDRPEQVSFEGAHANTPLMERM